MHSTPGPSSHPPQTEVGYRREQATPHPGLIPGVLAWCEVMAAGELTLSVYKVRTARALRGANCPSAPVSPWKGDIVTFTAEMTAASRHHALIPSLSLSLSRHSSSSSPSPKEPILFAMTNTIINDNKIFF